MPSTVNTSREFRPFRWIGWAAAACLIAYVAGLISAEPASAPAPPSAVCTH